MKYLLKIQSLGGIDINSITNTTNVVAISHEFVTDHDKYEKKRGRLFLVIHVGASQKFDLKQILKVFVDTVQEEYFRLNDNTPLHAIEKSLNKAYKNILSIKSKDDLITLSSPESNFSCSFATAIVWNSVLYTSYFGNAATYLIRGTGVRDLGIQNTYNDIWTSSSIIADNDVIIIGTSKFYELFPPKIITSHLGNLTGSIENSEQKNFISAILIKITSEKKESKISTVEKLKNLDLKNGVSQYALSIKGKIIKPKSLHAELEPYKSQKTAPVSSISGLISHGAPKSTTVNVTKTKPKRLSKIRGNNNRKWKALVLGMIVLASVMYANYKLFYSNSNKEDTEKITRESQNMVLVTNSNEKVKELHETFVNLDHVDQNAPFIDFTTTKDLTDYIYLISPKNLYQLNRNTKEAESIYSKMQDAKLLACDIIKSKTLCYIYENDTLVILDTKNTDKTDKYLIDKPNIIALDSYNDKIYFLQKSDILKMRLGTNNVESWLSDNQSLSNAIDFSTDGTSFFVISGRNILKYTNGKQAKDFEIDNSHLLKPTQIIAHKDKIYILDAIENGNKNIVAYNKVTGKFVKEIKLAEKTDLEVPAKFIIINDGDDTVVFKKGNYLYKVKIS